MVEVFPVVAGSMMVVVGVTLIIARRPFADFTNRSQQQMFGELGDRLTSDRNPMAIGIAGGIGAAIGLVMLLLGLFYRK